MYSKIRKSFLSLISAAIFVPAGTALAKDGAGLYVEPGIIYENLDTKIDWPTPFSSSTGTIKGLGVSARLGFHINEALFVAFDGRYSKPTFKDSSTDVDVASVSHNFGPVVGVQMPVIGLRIWGQYVMDGKLDPEEANGFDYEFSKGKGYRVGAGFRVSIVSINLEYQDLKYSTKVKEVIGIPFDTTVDDSDLKTKGFILGVSFPLEL